MTKKSTFNEQRKDTRYQVKDGVFIANSTKNGMVTDISMEGLSFRYIARKTHSSEECSLDIVCDEPAFQLRNLPYTIVFDRVTESGCPDRSLIVKKSAVRFGKLTPDQKAQLEYIIANLTITKAAAHQAA